MAHKAVQRLIRLQADDNGNLPSRIHVLSIGHWHTPWHGAFEHTRDDLAEMVMNFEAGTGLVDNKGKREAPGNFGHDRGGKAAFWITGLELEADGTELWANVTWTKAGSQAVNDGEYKYISPEWNPREFPWEDPEEEGTFVENVFTGAALTNIPLFKKLTPIMASADVGGSDKSKQHQGGDMKLEDLRVKKLEDLTAEEKAFLEENKADLTDDERTAFGLTVEPAEPVETTEPTEPTEPVVEPGEPVKASQGTVTIDAAKLASLEADAKAGRAAQQQLLKTELQASVKTHVDRGAIKSEQLDSTVEMLMASSEDARKAQLDFMAGLPDNKMLQRQGSSAPVQADVELTPEELEMANAFGNDPEAIKEFKKSQASA